MHTKLLFRICTSYLDKTDDTHLYYTKLFGLFTKKINVLCGFTHTHTHIIDRDLAQTGARKRRRWIAARSSCADPVVVAL